MRGPLLQLLEDFLSALVFLAVYAFTGQLLLATGVAIAIAFVQLGVGVLRRKPIAFMQWMAFGLVIVLGAATLLTKDSRYIRLKPSIAHFAIGTVMLRRGWQTRYLPPIARERIPERALVRWGYAWASLMFAMGLCNIAAAQLLDVPAWGLFITLLLLAKLLFGAIQYLVMRAAVLRALPAESSRE